MITKDNCMHPKLITSNIFDQVKTSSDYNNERLYNRQKDDKDNVFSRSHNTVV